MAATPITDAIGLTVPSSPNGSVELLEQASDATNGNSFDNTGVEVLVARNSDSGSHTVTFTYAIYTDPANPPANPVFTIPAGDSVVFGPFDPNVFSDVVEFLTSNVLVKVYALSVQAEQNILTR